MDVDMDMACLIRDHLGDAKRKMTILQNNFRALGMDALASRIEEVYNHTKAADDIFQNLLVKCHRQ